MKKSLNPIELRKITINEYLKKAKEALIESLIASQLEIDGVHTKLTSSRTNFGGVRYWFSCPICKRRCGLLVYVTTGYGCVKCLKDYKYSQ